MWTTKLHDIVAADYAELLKTPPAEGEKHPERLAFQNKRVREMLLAETDEAILKEVDTLVAAPRVKGVVPKLEWEDADVVGEEEIERRNELCARQE